jgi:hypothetical protein
VDIAGGQLSREDLEVNISGAVDDDVNVVQNLPGYELSERERERERKGE